MVKEYDDFWWPFQHTDAEMPLRICFQSFTFWFRYYLLLPTTVAENLPTRGVDNHTLTQGKTSMNTSKEMRASRVLLGWEQKDVAKAAGVNRSTIQRMEKLGRGHWSGRNAAKVRQALEKGGIIFIKSGLEGAGIRLTRSREFLDDLAEIGSNISSDVEQKSAAKASFENFTAEVHRFYKGDAYETEQIRSKLSQLKTTLEFEIARRGEDQVSALYSYVHSSLRSAGG